MANVFSIGDIRETPFTITRIFFFPNPKPDSNNCVVEGFRQSPTPIKDASGTITGWGDPKITPCKVFAFLPKGTTPNDIEFVRAEIIRLKTEQK